MQIAIDGPAGAGKSTIAKKIAQIYGITYLDTGAMYRCIAHCVLKELGDCFTDQAAIIGIAESAEIEFKKDQVFCNGEDVTLEIRTPLVSRHTSDVAKISEVRDILVKQQQAYAQKNSVIMDGRDIASVVLPRAEFKFYLDADVTERANRRHKELLQKDMAKDIEQIKQEIENRDENDKNRLVGPLRKVDEAILIDTTGLGIDEVVALIKSYIDGEAL
ncbi:(d)CMP kinase [Eubacteriaceae bacterium ES2]|nr:(d)CMP kinase [Eubacteriaceae bacterium ES2]